MGWHDQRFDGSGYGQREDEAERWQGRPLSAEDRAFKQEMEQERAQLKADQQGRRLAEQAEDRRERGGLMDSPADNPATAPVPFKNLRGGR